MTQRERVQASLEAEHDHGCYPQRCSPSEVHPLKPPRDRGDRERLARIQRLLEEAGDRWAAGASPHGAISLALRDVRLLIAGIARTT